ncbi:MAG: META domain-containing protein [Gammaproteobacteria bacterium]|nr:META domain-containing protein [Gammaproteobacteria bacterium]MDH4313368.1 META domain-containing protein [Gammaproteobacteria bacterium]MDH5213719.1 META domain-containing protein [Gammaproteobacteria bacterium]MDH5500922.1 META domain-containing protein [Gammaproteobacteria bacterium]
MSKVIAFGFFLLFLAAIAFVSLKGMRPVAELSASNEITGISWQPLSIGGDPIAVGSAMRLQFGLDGKLTGHSGCNGFSGDYSRDAESVEIGPLGATRMACPDRETTLENRFFDALQRTVTAESRAGRLILSDADGKVLAVLKQATPEKVEES